MVVVVVCKITRRLVGCLVSLQALVLWGPRNIARLFHGAGQQPTATLRIFSCGQEPHILL